MEESETSDREANQRRRGRPTSSKRGSKLSEREIEELNNSTNTDGTTNRTDNNAIDDGIILDEWQKDALAHDGNLLLCTGRQVGKTFIMSRKASEYMINHKNAHIIVCSLTEDQAQLMIIMVLDYLEKHYKRWIAKPYSKNVTKNKVVLVNGSQILARPVGNTGDAVRGFTGDVLILDEASRFNEFIFTASKPTLLTTGGQIWMCSTPFGKQGYFYEAFTNKNDRFKVIHTNSWDVINKREISEKWTQRKKDEAIKFLEEERKDMSELQFAQEYLGKFVDDLQQFFPDDLIKRCCDVKRRDIIPEGKDYYLGLDIARMGKDETSFEILERRDKNDLVQRENITTKKTLTTETFNTILTMHKAWKFRKIGIDAGSGSLGVGLLDFLIKEANIRNHIEALNNRSRALNRSGDRKANLLKEDMYEIMRMMMERGYLHLLDDDNLMLSLKSVQFEFLTSPGKKSQMRIFGNYTHIAEGLVRAAFLANQKKLNTKIYWC